jgi:ABC-type phosphate transport system substrate-binding protein
VRVRSTVLLILVSLARGAAGVADTRPPPGVFRVIVNPRNPVASVERRFLADVFLKKTTRWDDEESIRPVDARADARVRRAFSDEILKRSVEAVKNYWQQMVFSGRGVPPPELDTDDDVVKYVLKYPGAVGYVSASANLAGAKTLDVR